jgi:ABC-type multidrug transport system ATPase subunit
MVAGDHFRSLSARALRIDLLARLDAVGLGSRASQLAGQLSGGERQLLTLLMAELRDAPLLLFDEPLSALDPTNRARCIDLIKHLHDAGRTIIQVTHDLEYAADYGDRTVVLKGGRIAFESTDVPRSLERLREELYT